MLDWLATKLGRVRRHSDILNSSPAATMAETPEFASHVPDAPGFENRFVAFLDILGWRSFTNRAAELNWLRNFLFLAITDLHATTKGRLTNVLNTGRTVQATLDAQVSQFSDTIVISANATSDEHAAFGFLLEVGAVCRGCLFYGLLLRGGISIGPMYHRDSLAFGPALTEAYDLESKVARFPRVVLHPNWYDHASDVPSLVDSDIQTYHVLRKADDGLFFLDYLHPLVRPMHSTLPRRDTLEQFLKPAYRLAMDGLRVFAKDSKTREKYVWLATYYNEVLAELPSSELQPIDVLALDQPEHGHGAS